MLYRDIDFLGNHFILADSANDPIEIYKPLFETLNQGLQYFRGLGFRIPALFRVFARVEAGAAEWNSEYEFYFSESLDTIFLEELWGLRKTLGVQDPSVVLHELFHAIRYLFNKTSNNRFDDSVEEGFADYFAASITSNPRIMGRWRPELARDLREAPRPMRKNFHLKRGLSHYLGHLFAKELWRLRGIHPSTYEFDRDLFRIAVSPELNDQDLIDCLGPTIAPLLESMRETIRQNPKE